MDTDIPPSYYYRYLKKGTWDAGRAAPRGQAAVQRQPRTIYYGDPIHPHHVSYKRLKQSGSALYKAFTCDRCRKGARKVRDRDICRDRSGQDGPHRFCFECCEALIKDAVKYQSVCHPDGNGITCPSCDNLLIFQPRCKMFVKNRAGSDEILKKFDLLVALGAEPEGYHSFPNIPTSERPRFFFLCEQHQLDIAMDKIERHKVIYVDTEWSNKGNARPKHLSVMQISIPEGDYVIRLVKNDEGKLPFSDMSRLKKIIESHCVLKVFQDLREDSIRIRDHLGWKLQYCFDTKICGEQYYREGGCGLKRMVSHYYGVELQKAKECRIYGKWDDPKLYENRTLMEYARSDSYWTWGVFHIFCSRISRVSFDRIVKDTQDIIQG